MMFFANEIEKKKFYRLLERIATSLEKTQINITIPESKKKPESLMEWRVDALKRIDKGCEMLDTLLGKHKTKTTPGVGQILYPIEKQAVEIAESFPEVLPIDSPERDFFGSKAKYIAVHPDYLKEIRDVLMGHKKVLDNDSG